VAVRLPLEDLYAELGVPPDAPPEAIAVAFRARARALHPDANPDHAAGEQFKRLSAAYRVLSDPTERARYDAARVGISDVRPTSARHGRDQPARPAGRAPFLTPERAPWVLVAGIVLLALAVAVGAWVVAAPSHGPDATGRTVTLWIVVAKLVVGGIVAIVFAARRLAATRSLR
jgi:hypothetical protein